MIINISACVPICPFVPFSPVDETWAPSLLPAPPPPTTIPSYPTATTPPPLSVACFLMLFLLHIPYQPLTQQNQILVVTVLPNTYLLSLTPPTHWCKHGHQGYLSHLIHDLKINHRASFAHHECSKQAYRVYTWQAREYCTRVYITVAK